MKDVYRGKTTLLIRTILSLDEDAISRRLLVERTQVYMQNREKAKINEYDSPIFEILNTSVDVGLYETCINMITAGHSYSKQQWKKLVWESIWRKEDDDCVLLYL